MPRTIAKTGRWLGLMRPAPVGKTHHRTANGLGVYGGTSPGLHVTPPCRGRGKPHLRRTPAVQVWPVRSDRSGSATCAGGPRKRSVRPPGPRRWSVWRHGCRWSYCRLTCGRTDRPAAGRREPARGRQPVEAIVQGLVGHAGQRGAQPIDGVTHHLGVCKSLTPPAATTSPRARCSCSTSGRRSERGTGAVDECPSLIGTPTARPDTTTARREAAAPAVPFQRQIMRGRCSTGWPASPRGGPRRSPRRSVSHLP